MVLNLAKPKKATGAAASGGAAAGGNQGDVPEYVMPTGPVVKKTKLPESADAYPPPQND